MSGNGNGREPPLIAETGDRERPLVYHVERSRAKLLTMCGRRVAAVPTVTMEIARDPVPWREGSALRKLLPGIAPAICAGCAARA